MNPRLFYRGCPGRSPVGDIGRKGGIAMIDMILKRLKSEEALMEVFWTHIAPAVIGEHRLPDGKQLCR